jgi:hypothetical protein
MQDLLDWPLKQQWLHLLPPPEPWLHYPQHEMQLRQHLLPELILQGRLAFSLVSRLVDLLA